MRASILRRTYDNCRTVFCWQKLFLLFIPSILFWTLTRSAGGPNVRRTFLCRDWKKGRYLWTRKKTLKKSLDGEKGAFDVLIVDERSRKEKKTLSTEILREGNEHKAESHRQKSTSQQWNMYKAKRSSRLLFQFLFFLLSFRDYPPTTTFISRSDRQKTGTKGFARLAHIIIFSWRDVEIFLVPFTYVGGKELSNDFAKVQVSRLLFPPT